VPKPKMVGDQSDSVDNTSLADESTIEAAVEDSSSHATTVIAEAKEALRRVDAMAAIMADALHDERRTSSSHEAVQVVTGEPPALTVTQPSEVDFASTDDRLAAASMGSIEREVDLGASSVTPATSVSTAAPSPTPPPPPPPQAPSSRTPTPDEPPFVPPATITGEASTAPPSPNESFAEERPEPETRSGAVATMAPHVVHAAAGTFSISAISPEASFSIEAAAAAARAMSQQPATEAATASAGHVQQSVEEEPELGEQPTFLDCEALSEAAKKALPRVAHIHTLMFRHSPGHPTCRLAHLPRELLATLIATDLQQFLGKYLLDAETADPKAKPAGGANLTCHVQRVAPYNDGSASIMIRSNAKRELMNVAVAAAAEHVEPAPGEGLTSAVMRERWPRCVAVAEWLARGGVVSKTADGKPLAHPPVHGHEGRDVFGAFVGRAMAEQPGLNEDTAVAAYHERHAEWLDLAGELNAAMPSYFDVAVTRQRGKFRSLRPAGPDLTALAAHEEPRKPADDEASFALSSTLPEQPPQQQYEPQPEYFRNASPDIAVTPPAEEREERAAAATPPAGATAGDRSGGLTPILHSPSGDVTRGTPNGLMMLSADGSAGPLYLPTAAETDEMDRMQLSSRPGVRIAAVPHVVRRGPKPQDLKADLAPWSAPLARVDDEDELAYTTGSGQRAFQDDASFGVTARAAAHTDDPRRPTVATLADQIEEIEISFSASDVMRHMSPEAESAAEAVRVMRGRRGAVPVVEPQSPISPGRVRRTAAAAAIDEASAGDEAAAAAVAAALGNFQPPPGTAAAAAAAAASELPTSGNRRNAVSPPAQPTGPDPAETHLAAAASRAHGIDPTASFADMVATRAQHLRASKSTPVSKRYRSSSASTPQRGTHPNDNGSAEDATDAARGRTPRSVERALDRYVAAQTETSVARARSSSSPGMPPTGPVETARQAQLRRVRRAQALFVAAYAFTEIKDIPLPPDQRQKMPVCKGKWNGQRVTVSIEWQDFVVVKAVDGVVAGKTLLVVHPLIGNVPHHPLCVPCSGTSRDGKHDERLTFQFDRPPHEMARNRDGQTVAPTVTMMEDPPTYTMTIVLGSEWKTDAVVDLLKACVANSSNRSAVYRINAAPR
jgi:hypothetical protein